MTTTIEITRAEWDDYIRLQEAAKRAGWTLFDILRSVGTTERPEPRIVAECWTCAWGCDWTTSIVLPQTPGYTGAPLRAMPCGAEQATEHRAAGHDVRPVNKGAR